MYNRHFNRKKFAHFCKKKHCSTNEKVYSQLLGLKCCLQKPINIVGVQWRSSPILRKTNKGGLSRSFLLLFKVHTRCLAHALKSCRMLSSRRKALFLHPQMIYCQCPLSPRPHRNSARGCGARVQRGTTKGVAHSTCRSLMGLTVGMGWWVCPYIHNLKSPFPKCLKS